MEPRQSAPVNPLNHLAPPPGYIYILDRLQAGKYTCGQVTSRKVQSTWLVFIPSPTEDNDLIVCSHWGWPQEEVDSQLIKEGEAA